MSWHPIALALLFGLIVSATLHFIFIWPAREPHDDGEQGSADPENKQTTDADL